MSDLGSLVREVRISLASRQDLTGEAGEERIIFALNQAQDRLTRRHAWPEMQRERKISLAPVEIGRETTLPDGEIVTLDGDGPYVISSFRRKIDYDNLYGVFVDEPVWGRRKLRMIPHQLWRPPSRDVARSSEYSPTVYTIWNDRFKFYPRWQAHQPFIFLYTTTLPSFVPSAITPYAQQTVVLDRKDEIYINLAVSYLHGTYGNQEAQARAYAVAEALMVDAIADTTNMPDWEPVPHTNTYSGYGNPEYWRDPFFDGSRRW